MIISIVIPTRSRIHMLSDVLNNLYEKCDNPNRLEAICAFDKDDIESLSRLHELPDKPNLKFSVSENNHKYLGLHDVVNAACYSAKGDLIGTWNDDPIMLTRGWDTRLIGMAQRFPWAVIQTGGFTQFPFITRNVYNVLGHYSMHFSIDDYITFVGMRAGIEIRCPIEIHHDHSKGDAVADERNRIKAYIPYSFRHQSTMMAISVDVSRLHMAMEQSKAKKNGRL